MSSINFLHDHFLGNPIERYLWVVGILLFGLLIKGLLARLLTRLLFIIFKPYCKDVGIQKFVQLISAPVNLILTVLIFFFAFNRLTFPEEWHLVSIKEFGIRLILLRIFNVTLLASFIWLTLRLIDYTTLIFLAKAKSTASKANNQLITYAKEGIKVIVAGIGFFLLLSVAFQLDLVSLIAGLGIGGLAIALAARETLENLLGSFIIFLDKPFVVGDSVKVGSVEGQVESVGFRSTRIRALDKMLVVVPNKKMTEAELINETNRMVRRSNFSFLLSYETSDDQIKGILSDIKSFIYKHPMLEHGNESIHFKNFAQNGLEITVNVIVLIPVMRDFLDVQEEINLMIMEIVRNHQTEFAVPLKP